MALRPRTKLFIASAFASYIVVLLVVFYVFPTDSPSQESRQEAAVEDVRFPIPFEDVPRLSADELPGYWRVIDIAQALVFAIEGSSTEFFIEFAWGGGHGPFDHNRYARRGTFKDGVVFLDRPTDGPWTHSDTTEGLEAYTELVPLGWPHSAFT